MDAPARARLPFAFTRITWIRLYELAVFAAAVTLLTLSLGTRATRDSLGSDLSAVLFWTVLIALVELLPVPIWRSLRVSIGSPLFMAVAFIFTPGIAALIAFLAASDPREFRGEVRFLRALFNRSQIAISTATASLVFHVLGGTSEAWWPALPAAFMAVVADFLVNMVLVAVVLTEGAPLRTVIRKFRIGNPLEFLVSYIGLGLLGVILARLFDIALWAVAAFVLPLLLARQMFFRTRALEEATEELRDREAVLRSLSNRMAEERHDERMQIAGYLHDDMAQMLFRMSLHIDVLGKQLAKGDTSSAGEEVEAIRRAKQQTTDLLRSLIKDLRLSPLGRAGLAEALTQVCIDTERDYGIRVEPRVRDVDMPPPVQLLCYQLAREALMNAAKHAEASHITVILEPAGDGARVEVTDDGTGFDPEEGSPEGHFGLALMRERAQVAGGSLNIRSAAGEGSTISATFPSWWPDQHDDGEEAGASRRPS